MNDLLFYRPEGHWLGDVIADMVYQGLFSTVAENVLDLAPAGEDRDTELNELVGQKVGILRHRVDALGCQPHDARPARQDSRGHKGVLRTVAAKVHANADSPRVDY